MRTQLVHLSEVLFKLIGFRSERCSVLLLIQNVLFALVWKVMEMCYQILGQEKKVTQRELFYKLLSGSPQYFTSQLQVNRSIQGQQFLRFCRIF